MNARQRIARADLLADKPARKCAWECTPGAGSPHCRLHRHDVG